MKSVCQTLVVCLLLASRTAAAAEGTAKITEPQVKAALAELEKLTESTRKSTKVPGIAVAVVFQDQVVLLKGFGVRQTGRPERIDADTVFELASVSKPIAATVLAALVGNGTIRWDDRVIDHDPDFRLFDPTATRELRVRDLLCHRSGLPDHCGDLLEDIGYDRSEVLFRLRFQPPDSSFRSHYAYTNFGFTEAAVAAAKAAGQSWEDLAASKLYRPAGMNATSSRYADFAAAENRALLHVPADGGWTAKNTRQPDAQSPAGGVNSSLRDMTRWLRLQLGGGKLDGKQLVPADALAETHLPQMILGFDPQAARLSSYALGWNVSIERGGRVFYKHSGGFELGMRTEVALLPAEQLGIVVLVNAAPNGVPEALVESFFDLLLDGKVQRDWVEFANRMFAQELKKELGRETDYSHPPQQPAPALPFSAYAGQYENAFFGRIELLPTDDTLTLSMGPKGHVAFFLRHWDRDTFIFQPSGESAGGPSGVRFTIGPGERAARVLIENLNVHGQGTFERVEPGK